MDFPRLDIGECIAIDTETTGLSWVDDKVFSMSLSFRDGRDYYFDFRQNPEAIEWARAEFPKIQAAVGHNLKFDLHFLWQLGIELRPGCKLHDTGVYAALLNEHLDSYSLDAICKHYKLPVGKDTDLYARLAAIFGGKVDKGQMSKISLAPVDIVAPYAMADTRATFACMSHQLPLLYDQDLERVAMMEMDLLPALLRMEQHGCRVDVEAAERAIPRVTTMINDRQAALNKLAGFDINVNAPAQLRRLFDPKFREGDWWIGDQIIKTTAKGSPSIDKDVLQKIQHPAGKLVRGVKMALRIRDTFLLGHILGSQRNGIIHPTFNQTRTADDDGGEFGTTSGRLSCNNPNLQQISKRDKEAAEIVRSCFLPDHGQLWVSRDWSQMDFRTMAHYLNSPTVNALYADDPMTDFHTMVASLTGLPRSPKDGVKGNAKAVNLGLCFGMGKGRMAEEMGLPWEKVYRPDGSFWQKAGPEAEAIFTKYHDAVPGIKQMLTEMEAVAKQRGYVKTGFGRRIRFPGGERAYKAGAMIFQGTAADALKLKIIEADSILQGTDGRIIINVHDELCQSLPEGPEGEQLSEQVRVAMETFDGVNCPLRLRTPIRSSAGAGQNWWEASR
jgi:DNA polymerase-1